MRQIALAQGKYVANILLYSRNSLEEGFSLPKYNSKQIDYLSSFVHNKNQQYSFSQCWY